MSEKRLWDYLKDHVGGWGHFDRIESHATSLGRPDVNYCIDGVDGDIELKIYDPRRGGFILRANQNAWFGKRLRANGRCFVIARYDYSGGKRFLLIEGKNAKHLIHDRSYEGWANQASLIWEDRIDWEVLKDVLVGRGTAWANPN